MTLDDRDLSASERAAIIRQAEEAAAQMDDAAVERHVLVLAVLGLPSLAEIDAYGRRAYLEAEAKRHVWRRILDDRRLARRARDVQALAFKDRLTSADRVAMKVRGTADDVERLRDLRRGLAEAEGGAS